MIIFPILQSTLSIFGRWDSGYGDTLPQFQKQIPDGSVDAKAASASMVRDFMTLQGISDLAYKKTSFGMLFGSAHINGPPFIWSQSVWPTQKLRDVSNVWDGEFTVIPLYIK